MEFYDGGKPIGEKGFCLLSVCLYVERQALMELMAWLYNRARTQKWDVMYHVALETKVCSS